MQCQHITQTALWEQPLGSLMDANYFISAPLSSYPSQ